MGSDEPAVVADLDAGQVGVDVDEPADDVRVDGVVVAVDAHVVVPSQPDPVDPPERRGDRRKGQHRHPIGVEQVDRAGLDRAHHTSVGDVEPVAELGVEVSRGREVTPGHEGGFKEPVAPLHDTLRFRVVGLEPLQRRGQRAGERTDSVGVSLPTADPGLVVPDQPSRNPPEHLQQHPHPQQQISGVPGRDHPAEHEPGVRRGHHQNRQQRLAAVLERDLLRREPQIALSRVPGQPDQPVRRINWPMLRPQQPHVVAEPADRPSPPNPLRDHRRGHVRRRREQLSHRRLERRERRRHHRPLVPWRPVRRQRPLDSRPADAQVPRDLALRNTVRNQSPNQSPILHRDHPSNLSGWPRFRPSLWPRFQASPTALWRTVAVP